MIICLLFIHMSSLDHFRCKKTIVVALMTILAKNTTYNTNTYDFESGHQVNFVGLPFHINM